MIRRNPNWEVGAYSTPQYAHHAGGALRDLLFDLGGLLAHYQGDDTAAVPFAWWPKGEHLMVPDFRELANQLYQDLDPMGIWNAAKSRVGWSAWKTTEEIPIIGHFEVRPPGVVVGLEVTSTNPDEHTDIDDHRQAEDAIVRVLEYLKKNGVLTKDAEITWIYQPELTVELALEKGWLNQREIDEYQEEFGEDEEFWWPELKDQLLDAYVDELGEERQDAGIAEDWI